MLKNAVIASVSAALPRVAFSQSVVAKSNWQSGVIGYLENLSRPDGGYAWEDQAESHLTPTFAAIGCYKVLKKTPPRKIRLAEFIRTHHPAQLKKLEQEKRVFNFQQIQSLIWLGEDASELAEAVLNWKKPLAYTLSRHSYGQLN